MAYNTKNIIRDASGAPIPQLFNPAADEYQPLEGTGGAYKTQLSGSTLDLRGLAANKPAAASVAVGTTYWAVDTGIIEVSTGAAWVVV